MITINAINKFNNTLDIYCLSTDILPSDYIKYAKQSYKLTNGSTALCMDSGQVKIYDEENKTWLTL